MTLQEKWFVGCLWLRYRIRAAVIELTISTLRQNSATCWVLLFALYQPSSSYLHWKLKSAKVKADLCLDLTRFLIIAHHSILPWETGKANYLADLSTKFIHQKCFRHILERKDLSLDLQSPLQNLGTSANNILAQTIWNIFQCWGVFVWQGCRYLCSCNCLDECEQESLLTTVFLG